MTKHRLFRSNQANYYLVKSETNEDISYRKYHWFCNGFETDIITHKRTVMDGWERDKNIHFFDNRFTELEALAFIRTMKTEEK